MWRADLDDGDDVRQGDIIGELFVPDLKLPFRYASAPEAVPSRSTPILSDVQNATMFLVVSPCCTIQNYGCISVAPLSKAIFSDEKQKAAFMQADPSLCKAKEYLFRQHVLDPLAGVLEDETERKRLHVADLTKITTFTGDKDFVRTRRVGAMSAEGRRLLRIRLGAFWSRVEDGDAKILVGKGIPVGVEKDVVDVSDFGQQTGASKSASN